MKISCWVIAWCALTAVGTNGQVVGSVAVADQSTASAQVPTYFVSSRGPHQRVWNKVSQTLDSQGRPAWQTNQAYVEVATGMHHLQNGQWIESTENIDILPTGGAAATNGAHQAYFPEDIYQGAISLITPDGKTLRFRPVGLSYFDGTNSVMIAELTNSIGQIMRSGNRVVYTNAILGDVTADVRYTYTRAGFEQDIILGTCPPGPQAYGLNPATTRLQVLTEFFSPPQPNVTAMNLPGQAGVALVDDSLNFGAMAIGSGRAFLTGTDSDAGGVLVAKQWVQLSGRECLIEEVPVKALARELLALPQPAISASLRTSKRALARQLILPAPRLVKGTEGRLIQTAQANTVSRGLVLDFQTLTGSMNNYTFQGDTTYYISGVVNLFGTNNFEGGAVLKYAIHTSLNLQQNSPPTGIKWQASAYRPIIFTAVDDNSVGETIPCSTGDPSGNYYANPALSITGFSPPTISNFRIAYASQAISFMNANLTLYDGQIVNCQNGVGFINGSGSARNLLFSHVPTDFNNIGYGSFGVQNATFDQSYCLGTFANAYSGLSFVNCIFANVSYAYLGTPGSFAASYSGLYGITPQIGTVTTSSASYPFQTVGAGNYYLADSSPFRAIGTTNIDSTLLADLRKKTTWPPIVCSNISIITPTVWGPTAQRNTDVPDLGYHYDPLDYLASQVNVSSTLSLTNGVAIGAYGGALFQLLNGATVISQGGPTAMNRLTVLSMVQEQPLLWGGPITTIFNGGGYPPPNLCLRFTDCSVRCWLFWNPQAPLGQLLLSDCWIRGASLILFQYNSSFNIPVTFTNNLFERVNITLTHNLGIPFKPIVVSLWNNLFYGGSLTLTYNINPYDTGPYPAWNIYNNAFDSVTNLSESGNMQTSILNDYNGYVNTSPQLSGSFNNVPLTSFIYTNSFLGNYYQQSIGFVDQGSTGANNVGLYHYTTQASQVKETNTLVDIGFHYVATDQYGNPLDADGDGIADYLEDSNGNGVFDPSSDLSDWQSPNSPNGLSPGSALRVFTPLK